MFLILSYLLFNDCFILFVLCFCMSMFYVGLNVCAFACVFLVNAWNSVLCVEWSTSIKPNQWHKRLYRQHTNGDVRALLENKFYSCKENNTRFLILILVGPLCQQLGAWFETISNSLIYVLGKRCKQVLKAPHLTKCSDWCYLKP